MIDNIEKHYTHSILSRAAFLNKYEQVIDIAKTWYQKHLLLLKLLSVFLHERDFAGSSHEREDYNPLDASLIGIIESHFFSFPFKLQN